MSDKLRAAAKAALETLEDVFGKDKIDVGAINNLRAALAEPDVQESLTAAEQKPMLEINPQKREWVGLTDDEVMILNRKSYDAQIGLLPLTFYRAIEAKLREKNT